MKTNEYKLSEICHQICDGVHNTVIDTPTGDYYLLSAKNIKNSTVTISDDERKISAETYEKLHKRTRTAKGDILLTTVGASIGDTAIITDDNPNYEFQRSVGLFKPNLNFVIPEYLLYIFQSKSFQQYLYSNATGAAQPCLFLGLLKNIKISLPELKTQSKVVDIISSYDKLIYNNLKRIKTLEQMAENLYKEWFVRFRFPGHENAEFEDTKLGELPSSFQILKMKDVISYYIGGGWGNDEEDKDFSVEAYVIRGTDFPNVSVGNLSTCPLRYHKQSNFKSRKMQKHDIVIEISGGTDEKPVGRSLLVTQDVLERFDNRVICASFCKLVRLNFEVVSPIFFYYWMQFLYDTRIIDRYQLQSTGIINFQFEYFLKKGDIMIQPKELMEKFDELIEPIHNEIAALSKQNENLIKQRDLLLPRLMSGKLEV